MTVASDTCRYCGRQGGDAWSGGPDDPAPGVCPTCLDQRLAVLMRSAVAQAQRLDGPALLAWMEHELRRIGLTEVWARRFMDGDFSAFDAARERTGG